METVAISLDELNEVQRKLDEVQEILRKYTTVQQITLVMRDLHSHGGTVPHGTKIRYRTFELHVDNGALVMDEERFDSINVAARSIARRLGLALSRNAWTFFEYYDEDLQTWRKLTMLRTKMRLAA